MTPACAVWWNELWISGWSCWFSTRSSTMITFSLVHVCLVWHCSASAGSVFENVYFTR